MGEHGNMSHNFMHDVRLRNVIHIADVPDVLGNTEDFEGKGIEKLSLVEDAWCWFQSKSCFMVQVGA